MPSLMQRLGFGTSLKPPDSMQLHQPAANPEVIVQQPPGTSANGPAEPVLPLDQFKDIWSNPPADPKAPVDKYGQPLLNIDPAAIATQVGKMNFLDGISSELLTKATSGDAAAFSQVVNTSIQKALAAQVQLSGQMVEGAVSENNRRFETRLPKQIKEAQVNDVRSSNTVLSHPAAAPMLDMAKRSLMAKNPNLSPQEIHSQAEEMLSTFAQSLVEDKQKRTQPAPVKDPSDFSSWS
jgi:hypothetical protein